MYRSLIVLVMLVLLLHHKITILITPDQDMVLHARLLTIWEREFYLYLVIDHLVR
jgi:hypothetical protein